MAEQAVFQSNEEAFLGALDFDIEWQTILGPEENSVRTIPRSYINVAPQMRSDFPEEHIDNLSASIENTGLINPPKVFYMDEKSTRAYIREMNRLWDGNVKLKDYKKLGDGYLVLCAGECRIRAIDQLIDFHKYDRDQFGIRCDVEHSNDLYDLLKVQMAENIHQRPKSFRYAAVLREMYELGSMLGKFETEEDFVNAAPASRNIARNALTYYKLPQVLRDLVEIDTELTEEEKEMGFEKPKPLPYYHAIAMYPYVKAYRKHLQENIGLEGQDLEKEIETEFIIKSSHALGEGYTLDKLKSMVTIWVNTIQDKSLSLEEIHAKIEEQDRLREDNRRKKDEREFQNRAARNLEHSAAAIGRYMQLRGDVQEDITPRTRRVIQGVRLTFEALARLSTGQSISELALKAIEEADTLLDQAPSSAEKEEDSLF